MPSATSKDKTEKLEIYGQALFARYFYVARLLTSANDKEKRCDKLNGQSLDSKLRNASPVSMDTEFS